jgi:hypothetical protein
MSAYLRNRLRQCEALIGRITEEIKGLEGMRALEQARMEAYLDALQNMAGTSALDLEVEGGTLADGSRAPETAGIRLSPTWRTMMEFVATRHPNAVTVDELRQHAHEHGFNMTDETLRSQLSVYTAKGLLDRPDTGRYRIGAKGLHALGRATQRAEDDDSDRPSARRLAALAEAFARTLDAAAIQSLQPALEGPSRGLPSDLDGRLLATARSEVVGRDLDESEKRFLRKRFIEASRARVSQMQRS